MGVLINSSLLAAREIIRRPLRSSLTGLGIIIGVVAVVTMVTVGKGATQNITDQFNDLGANVIEIYNPNHSFSPHQLDSIQQKLKGLKAISPEVPSSINVSYGEKHVDTNLLGVTQGYFITNRVTLSSGRPFSELELRSATPVCILGRTVQKKLFKTGSAIGNIIRLNKLPCQIIATLKAKKIAGGRTDAEDQILIPLNTLQVFIQGNKNIPQLKLAFKSPQYLLPAKSTLTDLLRAMHKLRPDQEDDFYIFDPRDLISQINETRSNLNVFLTAIGSISLLVGGIGIMNIMLASVHERTKEIGIRLAIGALRHEVLLQFLIEAMLLASFGGLIGVILANLLSWQVCQWINVPYLFDSYINLLAFAFAALIGVVFGYLPARQAAQLDPIQALRHE